jgi:hypothetical protein
MDAAGNFVPWEVPHTCSSWVSCKSLYAFLSLAKDGLEKRNGVYDEV